MSFVKVNRDAFPKIFMFLSFFCFAWGLVFPVGGLLLKFDETPGLEYSLSTTTIVWLL